MTLEASLHRINPDAGPHPVPTDPRELDAALRAAERIWSDIPYFAERYGERGQRFGCSGSAWLASLPALDQAQVAGQVCWLAGVLAARGIPSMLLAAQLEVLVEELDTAVPERRDAYAGLRRAAAVLHEARRARIADVRLDALAARFDAGADVHWRTRLPRTGALLGCAVADEHTGYVGAVQSLVTWLGDARRFPPQSVAQVQRTLDEARDAVGEAVRSGLASSASGAVAPGPPRGELSFLRDDAPLAPLAREYADMLLRGERQQAGRLVFEACERGTPVKDLYLHVFQVALREIGRLWQINHASVAQEHYCTAATQLFMSQLYPRVFAAERNGRTLVMTCVGGELHELGARMVADFFEMDGWDTYFRGANTPAQDVVDTVAERHADVLGISVTLSWHVPFAQQLIALLRKRPQCAGICVLVGGNAFAHNAEQWRATGADGFALDAEQAVALATRWLSDEGARAG